MTTTEYDHDARAQIDALKATLTSVPGIGSSPGMVPPPLAEVWAEHQYELGVRVDPALATKKFQHPFRGPRSAYNPAGTYVPIDTPEPARTAIPKIDDYTYDERQGIIAQLYANGDLTPPQPEPNVAFIVND